MIDCWGLSASKLTLAESDSPMKSIRLSFCSLPYYFPQLLPSQFPLADFEPTTTRVS